MKVQTSPLLALLICILQSDLVFGQAGNLTCKKCDRSASLDFCTGSVRCALNEVCYMEELITDQLTVVYNGGCRSKEVCSSGISGSPSIGKRGIQKRADLVACSRCCNIRKKSGQLDCNARLCGIKFTNTLSTRCYLCDSHAGNAEQSDVDKPEDCLSETTCQTNEACGVERLDFNGRDSHKYTCFPRRICSKLTQEALIRKDECLTNPDPEVCGNVGMGKRAATRLCTACCGDGLCNSGSCEQVIDRLFNLWKGKALNFTTLKQTGTPKPVSTMQAITQASTKQPTPPPTQPSTKASTQAPTPPPTQPSTKASTQAPTPPPTQPSTKASTQPPTPPPTQPSTKASTQAPTPPPTQPSTKASTQAPTPPPTQPSTKASTQAPTPPPTQSSTKASTQAPTPPPTVASTQASTKAPTPPPTVASTQASTQAPTPPPTQASTPASTLAPTPPSSKPSTSAQPTPAVAPILVSQVVSTVAPSAPPTLTPSTVVAPNTTTLVGK